MVSSPGMSRVLANRRSLTLPKQPTELDDGLLTASEVGQLKLDADWVVLSARNTAAADKPGRVQPRPKRFGGAAAPGSLRRYLLQCRPSN
jgi:hypothetical protein